MPRPVAEEPKDAAEWVEAVVREMASASTMDDARVRAGRLLQAFERAVTRPAAAEVETLRTALQKEQHDTALLKRAVAIQHAKQQESAARDSELQKLRETVAAYQEQLRQAELTHYTLSMHLRQALEHSTMPGMRNPDIH